MKLPFLSRNKISIAAGVMICSTLAAAQEYKFFVPLDGIEPLPPEIVAWKDFAETNGIAYSDDWSTIDAYGKSLTGLPTETYPNSTPTSVSFRWNYLQHVDSLSSISSVSGDLNLGENDNLLNLDGLANLSSVGGILNLNPNNNLSDITGLSNLGSVGTFIYLPKREYAVRSPATSAFCNAVINKTISLSVNGTSADTSYPAGHLCVSTDPWIQVALDTNNSYTSDWATINWNYAWGKYKISSLPLTPYYNSTPDTVNLSSNDLVDVDALSSITSAGNITLSSNKISDITGLSSLTSVTGSLSLNYNQLTNLTGLENLTGVGNSLRLDYNANLTDISAISGLNSVGYLLSVRGNTNLQDLTPIRNLSNIGSYLIVDKREYTVKLTESDPLCQAIANGDFVLNTTNSTTGRFGPAYFCDYALNWSDFIHHYWPIYPNFDYIRLTNKSISSIPLDPYPVSTVVEIKLDNNSISDITGLSGIASIDRLYLNNNNITDLSPLSSITSFTTINLSNNSVQDLSVFSAFTSIGTLSLYGNQISDISPLSSLTSVTTLVLQSNPFEDLTPLQNITSGTVKLDNKEFTVKAPSTSDFCTSVNDGTVFVDVGLFGSAAATYSYICE